MSPFCAPSRAIFKGWPLRRSDDLEHVVTDTREPPPMLYARPGTPRSPAAIVAATASVTKVKSRVWLAVAVERDRLVRERRA